MILQSYGHQESKERTMSPVMVIEEDEPVVVIIVPGPPCRNNSHTAIRREARGTGALG